jgi:hypothetical protein
MSILRLCPECGEPIPEDISAGGCPLCPSSSTWTWFWRSAKCGCEPVEPVLLQIAAACERAGEISEPWATLKKQFHPRRAVRTGALPHWTRFAILPGLTRNGYAPPQWLKRRE